MWPPLPRSWPPAQRAPDPAACDPAAGARTSSSPAARSIRLRPTCSRWFPTELQGKIAVQTIVVPGDPDRGAALPGRAQQADLIVLGAQGASAFAAITRHGVVYKVLAHAHCPVITLSPVVLAECGRRSIPIPDPLDSRRIQIHKSAQSK
jgi:hypothetical protein